MADRERINVTLSPRDRDRLGWLCGERKELPAVVARSLITEGIERAIADPALMESYRTWRAGFSSEQAMAPQIAAAISRPGVMSALSGDHTGASMEDLRLASWIVAVSAWLRDTRPVAVKGTPPPRDTWVSLSLPHGAADVPFDEIDEAVSQALRPRPPRGLETGSDKGQLSDLAPHEAGEGRAHATAQQR